MNVKWTDKLFLLFPLNMYIVFLQESLFRSKFYTDDQLS